jgi:parallel beta-helix repeat protein
MKRIVPRPGLVIREDAVLEPGVHEFGGQDGIVIDADGITVDGRGAVLRSTAPVPPLPDDDVLYSPGDLGVSRETHELLLRRLEIGAPAPLFFEYRAWGAAEDHASVAVSRDRKEWRNAELVEQSRLDGGWSLRRCRIGEWGHAVLSLRFSVPAEALSPAAPFFYDGFRILAGAEPVWRGDAREHWNQWYNTGFTIYRRGAQRFYAGTAIRAAGRRGVKLRGCRAEGFLTGISLKDCSEWVVEGNDVSGNYDCRDYGWGEGTERYGGMYLDGVNHSMLRDNRGTRIWNGIVLRRCCDNTLEANEFSRCSNTCLKMSQSSRNLVSRNVFSWGLRIYPTEVHARDSVSLLVESGSDDNRFLANDFTHGGDGIFIRVLDHWCSTGNLFEGNDCSHANNNAVEAWSPGNTYVANRANWSSYGFWLGGSDDTVLKDNEVMHNGEEFGNAPEPFGNAGVSVVHGPSSGFLMVGNRIEDNRGPGISLAYRETTPAKLWLIAGNTIRKNRNDARGYAGHGLLLEYCEDVIVGRNSVAANEGRELELGRSCRHVTLDSTITNVLEGLSIRIPSAPTAGQDASLALAELEREGQRIVGMEFGWDFGDGTRERTGAPAVSHVYAAPGRYRVGVKAIGRGTAGIASRTVCVLPAGSVLADCSDAGPWRLAAEGAAALEVDPGRSATGSASLRATVRAGTLSVLAYEFPRARDLSGARGISFFYRYSCDHLAILSGKRGRRVGVRLLSADGRRELLPDTRFSGEPSEDRYDWTYFTAPFASFAGTGESDLGSVRGLEILFGPEVPADCMFWLDGLMAW